MYDKPTTSRLRDALHATRPPFTDEDRAVLKDRVCAFVDEVKAHGWPPEGVIVAVKHLANDAGFRSSPRVMYDGFPHTGRDAIVIDLVRWCVERYYGQHRDTNTGQIGARRLGGEQAPD